ncbi:MAG: hypothetical protein HY658_10725 [Actinobacteria bacterium]|nr:hypothetical protein [Actinomycetota bacterium]
MQGTQVKGEAPAGVAGPVCSVGLCPVSMLLTATQTVRPEVAEHLLAAGREFLLAVKAVIDSRAEGIERTSPLEKIQIT